MAGKSRSGQRIEPSFSSGSERGDDGFSAGERIAGGGRSSRRSEDPPPDRPRRAKSRRKQPRRERGGGFFGFVRSVIYWSLVLCLWAGIGAAGLVVYYGSRMPNASTWAIPDRPPNVKIADLGGSIIANRGATGGEALTLSDMSPYIPKAIVAIEDRRFYSHFGFDPIGLGRAVVTNVLTGHAVQGGSTLTQQLAKNLFLSPERTLERKVQEVLLAIWLEHKYTKDQILTMYLNRVYFGANAYGVEAASQRYFNKSARDVNLGEAAMLAGLVKAPSKLSPARDPAAAEARAQLVLQAMRDQGFISEADIKTAMSQPPTHATSYWNGAQNYVADMVMDQLPGLIGGAVKEDLTVDTTIDTSLEQKAEQSLNDVLAKDGKKLNASQASLVSVDATGAIRALVGGRDYAQSQFNRAVTAKRQPGSAFKPFVYTAALEMGLTPNSIRNDAPVKIGNWAPENYEQKYNGPVTLATAVAHSLNTVAAQLAMEVGPEQVVKVAHRLGIESDLQANASIALGTSEVSLLELTSAYASFMNGGYKATPHVITKVTTASGKVLYQANFDNPPRVLNPDVVTNMNTMMTGVINFGTGKAARIPGWQAAGKSGTTQSFRDALFVGFTSHLTTGVWFGNDDGKSMKKVTGGGLPAKAWKEFMVAAHKGLTPTPIFGGGQIIDNGAPVVASAPNTDQQTTIGSIISGALGGNGGQASLQQGQPTLQQRPAQQPVQQRQQPVDQATLNDDPEDLPPVGLADNNPYSSDEYDNGDIPPADIGDPGPITATVRRHRSSLLDVILGQ
ncbi:MULTISPECIES: transglycosylase domain-containing protein [unclassified Rhizobium]|uniref:transglycosylase domain-containing protein n=1 Tax=unclassified Rhizobium TaxID=2613769 RepID=UPI000CDF4259|nr:MULTISPECIES: transglycosylase domain-containing protein [Rhizobium]AVA19821.1 penicillin binding protein 1A [Rhizobium sp. NXC24]MDK4743313.1 transglycosylase domain-containing protein [Rhizobium sp. CNPSo 3464]UWU21140.1 penicillin-binding protein [Rhizobium tropici]